MSYRIFRKIVEGNKYRKKKWEKIKECLRNVSFTLRNAWGLFQNSWVPLSIRLPTFSNVYLFELLSMTKHQKDINLVFYKANWLSEKTVQATNLLTPKRVSIWWKKRYKNAMLLHFYDLNYGKTEIILFPFCRREYFFLL